MDWNRLNDLAAYQRWRQETLAAPAGEELGSPAEVDLPEFTAGFAGLHLSGRQRTGEVGGGLAPRTALLAGRSEAMWRMEASAPASIAGQQAPGEGVDATVEHHNSAPAAKSKRRSLKPYREDEALIKEFMAGAKAGGSTDSTTRVYGISLRQFSHYLQSRRMNQIKGRLDDRRLDADVEEYLLVTGPDKNVKSALKKLREFSRSRVAAVQIQGVKSRCTSERDQALIDRFESAAKAANLNAGTLNSYRSALLDMSRWLSAQPSEQMGPSRDGLAGRLHEDGLTADVRRYVASEGKYGAAQALAALACLRRYDTSGKVTIRNGLSIPDLDKQLIDGFQEMLSAEGTLAKSSIDRYKKLLRMFSDTLQGKGKPGLAARLHHPSLLDDKALFPQSKGAAELNSLLNRLRRTIQPQMLVNLVVHETDPEWFVRALGAFSVAGRSLSDVAERMDDATEDALRQLLDEESDNGLTPLGTAYLQTLAPHLRQLAEQNLALRAQSQAWAEAGTGDLQSDAPRGAAEPSSPFHMPPASSTAWPNFDLYSPSPSVDGPAHSPGHSAAWSAYEHLTPLDSRTHLGFDMNTPLQEVDEPPRAPEPADSGFTDLGSLDLAPHRTSLHDDAHYGGADTATSFWPPPASPGPAASQPTMGDPELMARRLAARRGIPYFGPDVVGSDWRGFAIGPDGQPTAPLAPDRLAGRIRDGQLINVLGVDYYASLIRSEQTWPSAENPLGQVFALLPHHR